MKLLEPSNPITAFTGKPFVRPAAKPSFLSQVRNGRVKPRDVLDVVAFGTVDAVAACAIWGIK